MADCCRPRPISSRTSDSWARWWADRANGTRATGDFVTAFVRPGGLDVPATPVFVDAVERLAAEGRHAPDPALTRRTWSHAFVASLASASRSGLLRWLLMDTFDIPEAAFERDRDADKQRVLEARADQWDQERRRVTNA